MEKRKILIVIIALVLSVVGLAYPIFEMVKIGFTLEACVKILCYLFAIYYLVAGYKKPHGNLMKILFLFFAFTVVLQAVENAKTNVNSAYLTGVAGLFIAYSAGRLNKIKNNQISAVIVLVLLLLGYGIGLAGVEEEQFLLKVMNLDLVLEWVAIALTYFVRSEMHIDAGKKQDDKENQVE